jgi:glycosyltransferase involved in cell wall biosynthesis
MVTVVLPIGLMDEERWDRYKPQFIPLANNLKELHILAMEGYEPKMNIKNVFFHFYKNNITPKINAQQKSIVGKSNFLSKKVSKVVMDSKKIRRKIINAKRFAHAINDLDVDLIYGLSAGGFQQFAHIEMKKIKNIPAVYRMRGYGVKERKFKETFPFKEANNIIDFYTSTQYDLYIPIKNEYVNILKNRGIDEKRISKPIINGVDINVFKSIQTPSELTIGYAGRVSEEKGINFLLKLMRSTKTINYVIAGKEQMEWKIPDNCIYYGLIPHDEMVNFYNKCNVIVLPSYTEGVSNVILEAYACGRVLIMSKNATPPEIPNFGWELPHDIKLWNELVESLDIDELIERGLKAKEWVKGTSWEEYGSKMAAQFKKVVRE